MGTDDAAWARGRGWAPSIALKGALVLPDDEPGVASNARHVIGEVLADTVRDRTQQTVRHRGPAADPAPPAGSTRTRAGPCMVQPCQ
ncbi:hypothetical protein [Streptomyces sp. NPDC057418]|uniref:hypothetical protein n=1 Tax=Streptomyces sp. NPDC057418 TaxID=3346126 RepID=UPI0036BE45B6